MDRSRLVAGRRANADAPDEVTVGETLARQLHQGVGGHLDFASYTPAQFATAQGGGRPPPPAGPRVRLQIVGIVRRPGDLGDTNAGGGIVVLTPAFNHAYLHRIANFGVFVQVRTRHGASAVPGVVKAARPIFAKSGGLSVQAAAEDTRSAQSAIDVLSLTLWVFAGVAGLAGVVTIGIVLTREIALLGIDQETLRALGATRAQRVMVSGPSALLIAAAGGLLAALGAIAASPLLPIGVARRADPDVGFHLDWVVLAVGVIAVGFVVLVIALLAAVRGTRESALDPGSGAHRRTSTVVETAGRAGLAPTATNGLRMALEPGRGRTAVPVRSAYLGAIFGVLGVTAILVFTSSLDHLVATPRLYGATWDFQAADTNFKDTCGRNDFGLTRVTGVGAIAAVCTNDIQLDGHTLTGWGFTRVRGTIQPAIVTGRAPRAPNEVALGHATLHTLGKGIGDTVRGRGPHGTAAYRIVGQVVFPSFGNPQALADGGAFTGAGLTHIFDSNATSNRYLVGRYTPRSDHTAVDRRIAALSGLGNPATSTVPVEIGRLRHIGWLPVTLAALLGGLALLAVGHALVTTVRRRRRDLAVLKTLGFDRRQVRRTIAWQATILAAVGLVLGIPLGIAIGRAAWRLSADGLGISTVVVLPTVVIFLGAIGVLALINLVALFPARAAAGTRTAKALRSD